MPSRALTGDFCGTALDTLFTASLRTLAGELHLYHSFLLLSVLRLCILSVTFWNQVITVRLHSTLQNKTYNYKIVTVIEVLKFIKSGSKPFARRFYGSTAACWNIFDSFENYKAITKRKHFGSNRWISYSEKLKHFLKNGWIKNSGNFSLVSLLNVGFIHSVNPKCNKL